MRFFLGIYIIYVAFDKTGMNDIFSLVYRLTVRKKIISLSSKDVDESNFVPVIRINDIW